MTLHFTYQEPDFGKLKQGDILKKTPELLDLINKVHPHYSNDDYIYFQVLTQSCDLVLRKGLCKSRYITIAAVRSLDVIVSKTIKELTNHFLFENNVFCSTKHKQKMQDMFDKLLNNNDTNHFYLEESQVHGINQKCCTQLHLSIAIKSNEHYHTCLNAKILELSENFQSKLGWLVGNLYSRVGTQDYVPGAVPDNNAYLKVRDDLLLNYVAWVEQSDFSLYKSLLSSGTASFSEVGQKVKDTKNEKINEKLDKLVKAISKPLSLNESQRNIVKNVISQYPGLSKFLS